MNPSLTRRLAVIAMAAVLVPLVNGWPATAADPPQIVPAPAAMTVTAASYPLTASTQIVGSGIAADTLATVLRRSTGFPFPVVVSGNGIRLSLVGGLPQEGYRLDVTAGGVTIGASTNEGLLRGVQTFRQLLPAKVESASVQPGPWTVGGVSITDRPRFGWRGVMLDVARHFFTVADVKRYIDQAALYKMNVLHLHLADDQGWRIQVDGWPRLTTYGGSTEVGVGTGGHYTKADYAEIVRYAGERFMTVVPEIDMPGHTNAALASYPQLNCDGTAPPLYTGTDVGFSSLCIAEETTYQFVEDVVAELAAMTPGPYLHIGGDEAHSTPTADYVTFMNRVAAIVTAHGKKPVGWQEIGQATLPAGATGQFWGYTSPDTTDADNARSVVTQGGKLVMSPANAAYLDMKYNPSTPYGLSWAGYVEVRQSYEWNPATVISGITETAIRGVEAPLWTENVTDIESAEFMANPRLAAIAEIGWSPQTTRTWQDFSTRLAAQAPRWAARGTTYHRSTQVPWPGEHTGTVAGTGSGRCLDVPGSVTTDSTLIVLRNCHGGPNQQWTSASDGTLRALGRCLTPANTANGAAITLTTCTTAALQKWTYDPSTKLFRNPTAARCLDADGTTNGTKLITWTCHGGPRQQWTIP